MNGGEYLVRSLCSRRSVRDQWAKNGSANPNIKVYIGALAGQGGSGYVSPNSLAGYITHAQDHWSSFGGIMLWEASLAVGMAHNLFFIEAYLFVDAMQIANNNYHKTAKNSLLRGGGPSDPPSANRTASTSLQTPGATSTSPCTTSYSPYYTDGAKWYRRSRSQT